MGLPALSELTMASTNGISNDGDAGATILTRHQQLTSSLHQQSALQQHQRRAASSEPEGSHSQPRRRSKSGPKRVTFQLDGDSPSITDAGQMSADFGDGMPAWWPRPTSANQVQNQDVTTCQTGSVNQAIIKQTPVSSYIRGAAQGSETVALALELPSERIPVTSSDTFWQASQADGSKSAATELGRSLSTMDSIQQNSGWIDDLISPRGIRINQGHDVRNPSQEILCSRNFGTATPKTSSQALYESVQGLRNICAALPNQPQVHSIGVCQPMQRSSALSNSLDVGVVYRSYKARENYLPTTRATVSANSVSHGSSGSSSQSYQKNATFSTPNVRESSEPTKTLLQHPSRNISQTIASESSELHLHQLPVDGSRRVLHLVATQPDLFGTPPTTRKGQALDPTTGQFCQIGNISSCNDVCHVSTSTRDQDVKTGGNLHTRYRDTLQRGIPLPSSQRYPCVRFDQQNIANADNIYQQLFHADESRQDGKRNNHEQTHQQYGILQEGQTMLVPEDRAPMLEKHREQALTNIPLQTAQSERQVDHAQSLQSVLESQVSGATEGNILQNWPGKSTSATVPSQQIFLAPLGNRASGRNSPEYAEVTHKLTSLSSTNVHQTANRNSRLSPAKISIDRTYSVSPLEPRKLAETKPALPPRNYLLHPGTVPRPAPSITNKPVVKKIIRTVRSAEAPAQGMPMQNISLTSRDASESSLRGSSLGGLIVQQKVAYGQSPPLESEGMTKCLHEGRADDRLYCQLQHSDAAVLQQTAAALCTNPNQISPSSGYSSETLSPAPSTSSTISISCQAPAPSTSLPQKTPNSNRIDGASVRRWNTHQSGQGFVGSVPPDTHRLQICKAPEDERIAAISNQECEINAELQTPKNMEPGNARTFASSFRASTPKRVLSPSPQREVYASRPSSADKVGDPLQGSRNGSDDELELCLRSVEEAMASLQHAVSSSGRNSAHNFGHREASDELFSSNGVQRVDQSLEKRRPESIMASPHIGLSTLQCDARHLWSGGETSGSNWSRLVVGDWLLGAEDSTNEILSRQISLWEGAQPTQGSRQPAVTGGGGPPQRDYYYGSSQQLSRGYNGSPVTQRAEGSQIRRIGHESRRILRQITDSGERGNSNSGPTSPPGIGPHCHDTWQVQESAGRFEHPSQRNSTMPANLTNESQRSVHVHRRMPSPRESHTVVSAKIALPYPWSATVPERRTQPTPSSSTSTVGGFGGASSQDWYHQSQSDTLQCPVSSSSLQMPAPSQRMAAPLSPSESVTSGDWNQLFDISSERSSILDDTMSLASDVTTNLSRDQVISWYHQRELPRGVGVDALTGRAAAWFHGIISRQEAENRLLPCPPGAYLVRLSLRCHGYTLSYRCQKRCKHFLVEATAFGTGGYRFYGNLDREFSSLEKLLRFHTIEPITVEGAELLRFPCTNQLTASASQLLLC